MLSTRPATAAAERLADLTTLRLGGPAEVVHASDEAGLVAAVADADAQGVPVLVLGGGSNVVVADEGFSGRVVRVETRGVEVVSDLCGGAYVTVAAGEPWDDLVTRAVEEGWLGLETLAGIPGTVGAAPIQNIGAYGQELCSSVAQVRVYDRMLRGSRTFAYADCRFGYRTSRFKADPGRHVVLSVTLQLRLGDLAHPLEYAELAGELETRLGARPPLREAREAVLALRRRKGMVLDAADHDTWSAGSFFTNPVLGPDQVPSGAPAYPLPDGRVKTSAAWLIERAGFGKGYGLDLRSGRVSLSTKHTLALTNRGGGTTAELVALAAEVRDGVRARFAVTLENEPVLVGVTL
jgi:UDP-N-acetylmuramate dehydrogenase